MEEQPDIKKVALYYRFSSDEHDQKENSERRQLDDLHKFCYSRGYELVWKGGDEEIPGWTEKPTFNSLKELCKTELSIDALVVTEFSRLSRKDSLEAPTDILWLRDLGIRLLLQETGEEVDLHKGTDLVLLQFKIWQANEEVKKLAKRVKSGIASRFRDGILGWSTIPFGFDPIKEEVDKKVKNVGIKPNDDIIHVVRMFHTYLEGGTIGDCLIHLQKGKKYQEGANATGTSVKQILRNAIYCGKRTFGVSNVAEFASVNGRKEKKRHTNVNVLEKAAHIIDVDVPKVVTLEDFQKVQSLLDRKKTRGRRSKENYKYTRTFRCGKCGRSMIGAKSARTKEVQYCCWASKQTKQTGCSGGEISVKRKTISEKELEQLFSDACEFAETDRRFHKQIFYGFVVNYHKSKSKLGKEHNDKLAMLKAKKGRIKELMDLFVNENLKCHDQIKQQQQEVERLEAELEAASTDQDAWQCLMDRVHLVASSSGLGSPAADYLISLESACCTVVEDGQNIDDTFRVWFDDIVKETSVWNLKDNWREVGISQIDINWKPGKKRGRDAWVPDGLNFRLSLGDSDAQIKYTNTGSWRQQASAARET